jgi:hypothetical protein
VNLTKIQLAKLHEKSSLHVAEMRLQRFASCFHCLKRTDVENIKEFTDCGLTCLCPGCYVDALLPGEYGLDVLKQMYKEYFSS